MSRSRLSSPSPIDVLMPPQPEPEMTRRFAADVCEYLQRLPRQLPSAYLYDALGSALFEAVCHLPWYGITRAEARLLASHGGAVIGGLGDLSTVVELGSGSGEKLRLLLTSTAPYASSATSSVTSFAAASVASAVAHRPVRPLVLHLIDLSGAALAAAARTLHELDVSLVTHGRSYEAGLAEWAAGPRLDGRTLMMFLGSNLGNFDPPGARTLLAQMRAALSPDDGLLLGVDLVKPEFDLLLAYDDPLQVTAAFNRNLLVRINRELGGTFDISRFAHRATWNPAESRVEMHLVALADQRVSIAVAGLQFEISEGEHIWTESSYKYEPEGIAALLGEAGFRCRDQWIDPAARFALVLAEAA